MTVSHLWLFALVSEHLHLLGGLLTRIGKFAGRVVSLGGYR